MKLLNSDADMRNVLIRLAQSYQEHEITARYEKALQKYAAAYAKFAESEARL